MQASWKILWRQAEQYSWLQDNFVRFSTSSTQPGHDLDLGSSAADVSVFGSTMAAFLSKPDSGSSFSLKLLVLWQGIVPDSSSWLRDGENLESETDPGRSLLLEVLVVSGSADSDASLFKIAALSTTSSLSIFAFDAIVEAADCTVK